MSILAGGITHGQAVALVLLCIFLIIFIVVDVYLVLFLHRRNKKLANDTDLVAEESGDGTSITTNENQTDLTE